MGAELGVSTLSTFSTSTVSLAVRRHEGLSKTEGCAWLTESLLLVLAPSEVSINVMLVDGTRPEMWSDEKKLWEFADHNYYIKLSDQAVQWVPIACRCVCYRGVLVACDL